MLFRSAPLKRDPALLAQRVDGQLGAWQAADEFCDRPLGRGEGRELIQVSGQVPVSGGFLQSGAREVARADTAPARPSRVLVEMVCVPPHMAAAAPITASSLGRGPWRATLSSMALALGHRERARSDRSWRCCTARAIVRRP